MKLLIRATVRQAKALWVLTPSLRGSLDGLSDPARIDVLGCVVEDPIAGREPVQPPAADGRRLRVLFLSNLREGKGHDDLLAALGELGERAAEWDVRLVGEHDASTAAEIGEWIRIRAGSGACVELVGPRTGDGKIGELEWADVFVLPSRYRNEGQPLVILEALAAGLPVVSTCHRGIPDTVRDGREALLVEPGDVPALAEALARLAEQPELRAKLGAAARQRYLECFSQTRIDEPLERLLRD